MNFAGGFSHESKRKKSKRKTGRLQGTKPTSVIGKGTTRCNAAEQEMQHRGQKMEKKKEREKGNICPELHCLEG